MRSCGHHLFKIAAFALALVAVVPPGVDAQEGTRPRSPERLDECRALATKRALKGSERAAFLNECTERAGPDSNALPAVTPSRDETRERLKQLLVAEGARADIDAKFEQNEKNPYSFSASIERLQNADNIFVIVSASSNDMITVRAFPRIKGAFVNVDRAANKNGLMRHLLSSNYSDFFSWGADDEGDVFALFAITLESGFPYDALVEVLRNVRALDKRVGTMREFIGGEQ